MNNKPQVALTITERPDGLQLWDRHFGLLAIWGSICRLGNAIHQQAQDIVLDLSDASKQHGPGQPRSDVSKKHEPK